MITLESTRKGKSGFTIVELLIVVVVIAILAAITIVSFNGIQAQAANSKTSKALSDWVKILNMYRADNGRWPNGWTCLGEGYPSSPATSGSNTGHCRSTNTDAVTRSPAFETELRKYAGGGTLPTPSFVMAANGSNEWRRGIHYAYGGGGSGTEVYIQVTFQGSSAECPSIANNTGRVVWGGNVMCTYLLGLTTDT